MFQPDLQSVYRTAGHQKGLGSAADGWNTALRLQIIKDLWLKGDLFAWSGPKFLEKDSGVGTLAGAFDLNAGLEFRITKNINLWSHSYTQ